MTFKWTIAIFNALFLFIIVLCLSVQIPTFDLSFFEKEYTTLNTAAKMNMQNEELMNVTKELLEYIRGRRADLVVQAKVGETDREFFNQREKDHMVDVKDLFLKGFFVRNIATILFVLTFVILTIKNIKNIEYLARSYILVFLALFAFLVIIGFIISMDFDKYFTMFHEMFFTNDLWILNPETDLLINLVPLEFFMDISKYIARTFARLSGAVLLLSYIYLKFYKIS